jgi:hypothetical protein
VTCWSYAAAKRKSPSQAVRNSLKNSPEIRGFAYA